MGEDRTRTRWQIRVRGIVQGVGFRPFVYGLARRLDLGGFVQNDSEGVLIEAQGPLSTLAAFTQALRDEAPPLARVDAVEHTPVAAVGSQEFVIAASHTAAQRATLIAAHTATCADCLRELFDPADRRFGYPFINCTNCGPRFTIVADVPYDRPKTTMRVFPMCAACQAEYDNPLDRRFHAQPNACPVCGPRLTWRVVDPAGPLPTVVTDPIAAAAGALAGGAILAIKGLGGYHLACDALDPQAVHRLRQRKRREAKPFALMVADLEAARRLCLIDEQAAALLSSHRRPIMLLERHADLTLAPDLAPGHTTLGLMLPYTPLHHLLLHAFTAQRGPEQPTALVMTSGNLSDEPIAYRNAEAFAHLSSIADAFLDHDREILTRCDDTVARIAVGDIQLLRRSRGYAPEPLQLKQPLPLPVLAYGAHLKNTFCLAQGRRAFVSHHIGDLENLETLESFREGIVHFQRLFDIAPELIAYDLHPGYLATQEALASPVARKVGVQHHHAHIASVIVEHGLSGPVIGVAADGSGYGGDGTIWGGEIMLATLADFERLGHLATVALPGGEQAVRQPWRVAAAYLAQAYGPAFLDLDLPFTRSLDQAQWRLLAHMIERRLNSPLTSSLGRLFDAVAALIGLRGEALYEGQAAIELEAIATRQAEAYPFTIEPGHPFVINLQPTLTAIVADIQQHIPVPVIAGRFHAGVSAFLTAACRNARASGGVKVVALSGGVFQNRLLLEQLTAALSSDGFTVYTNRRVPPNDGGLSLGQVAVAAARS